MDWIALSYTLPSTQAGSSPRVAFWRRLRRLGAISPLNGLHVLPAREACLEAFQWLAEEIRQEGGDAFIIHVDRFEGLPSEQLVAMFCAARKKEYDEMLAEVEELLRVVITTALQKRAPAQMALNKLRRRFDEIRQIDYFSCPEGLSIEKALDELQRTLLPGVDQTEEAARAAIEDFLGQHWVTRPRPHVDRLACVWLIRRFIDAQAVVRYASVPEPGEIAFDMPGGRFTHRGNLCTFETMLHAFHFRSKPGLLALAEIVHEVDLRDNRYERPEAAGVAAILQGWLHAGLSDDQLEQNGLALFDGLYAGLAHPVTGATVLRAEV